MNTSQARALFKHIADEFFKDYQVIYANQSRTPKPAIPLVTILSGNLKRDSKANYRYTDGDAVGHYLSMVTMTVDLFTNGRPITGNGGYVVAYENTAVDELTDFMDFMNGMKCTDFCRDNDISLSATDVQDMTNVVNDTTYQYRARIDVSLYFTHDTGSQGMGTFSNAIIKDSDCIN